MQNLLDDTFPGSGHQNIDYSLCDYFKEIIYYREKFGLSWKPHNLYPKGKIQIQMIKFKIFEECIQMDT